MFKEPVLSDFGEAKGKEEKREFLLAELENCELVTDQDRTHLILVMEGLKDVCNVELVNPSESAYGHNGGESYTENTQEFHRNRERLESTLKKLNLPYEIIAGRHEAEDHGGMDYDFFEFDIGKDQASLDLLHRAGQEIDPEKKQEALGRVFGIPPTAVKAWKERKIKQHNTLPADILESDAAKFIDFALSEDHWQEEFEVVRQRAETIKRLAPDLYRKMAGR